MRADLVWKYCSYWRLLFSVLNEFDPLLHILPPLFSFRKFILELNFWRNVMSDRSLGVIVKIRSNSPLNLAELLLRGLLRLLRSTAPVPRLTLWPPLLRLGFYAEMSSMSRPAGVEPRGNKRPGESCNCWGFAIEEKQQLIDSGKP